MRDTETRTRRYRSPYVPHFAPLFSQSPPSPERPSGANPRLGRQGGEALPLLTYSDFLDEMFGDGEGKDNQRMKEARDERKVEYYLLP